MNTINRIVISLILAVAGCFISQNSVAQQADELLIKANSLYNESAYDSAAVLYEKILDEGYSSASLYYNLGNTYYKMGNYPMAILNYEKSLKLDPNNNDTKHNVDIARKFISDKIEPVPELFIKTWWNNLSNMFTLNTWAIVSIVSLGCMLLCIFVYIIARTRAARKSMFFISLLLLIITSAVFGISINKYRYINSSNEGIIITPTITVKSSPSSSSVDLFVLHEGSKVKILDNTDSWDKIKIANGSIGWIPSSTINKY